MHNLGFRINEETLTQAFFGVGMHNLGFRIDQETLNLGGKP